MSSRIREVYLIVLYILGFAGIAILIATGLESIWISIIFSLGWLLSFTIRNLLIYNTDNYRKFGLLTYLFETVILICIGKAGAGGAIKLLLLITYSDCFIVWGLVYGVFFFLIILLGLIIISKDITFSSIFKDLLMVILKESPVLLLTGIVSYLIGKVFRINFLLENSVNDIGEREVKLTAAYEDLNAAFKSLEEITILKERNRIAREIHDTVGHTLTNVIVEMEAAKLNSDKQPELAKKSYEMAQSQVVKALNEMRHSVRMLSEDKTKGDLIQLVTDIIEDTCKHTGVSIKYEIEAMRGIRTRFDDLVVRALKEGISNSIRHGASNVFLFKLVINEDRLYFLLQDNGTGCTEFSPGFGLSNMRKGIEQSGGNIMFRTEPDEGFEIEFILPLK
ncbi:MAG: histidine kinase [Bacillota bacterium]|nr:histidine kinase [Bacillota bacterium]